MEQPLRSQQMDFESFPGFDNMASLNKSSPSSTPLNQLIRLLELLKAGAAFSPIGSGPTTALLEVALGICKLVDDSKQATFDAKVLATHAAVCVTSIIRERQARDEEFAMLHIQHPVEHDDHIFKVLTSLTNAEAALKRIATTRKYKRLFKRTEHVEEIKTHRQEISQALSQFSTISQLKEVASIACISTLCDEILSNGDAHLLATLSPMHETRYDAASAPSPCHVETRRDVLKDVISCVTAANAAQRVIEITGPAGYGKSAITQSLCRQLAQDRVLAASFIFTNSVSETLKDPRAVVRSIAFQLASVSTTLRRSICETLREHPNVDGMDFDTTLDRFIRQPLEEKGIGKRTLAIVLDGLYDAKFTEPLDGAAVSACFARVILRATTNVRLVITTRTPTFKHDDFQKVLNLRSDISKDEIVRDVERYLKSSFTDISLKHRHRHHLDRGWFTDANVSALARRCGHFFLLAKDILSYVGVDHDIPSSRLAEILDGKPKLTLYKSVDSFYTRALGAGLSEILACDLPEIRQRRRDLLGAVVVLQTPLTQGAFIRLLGGRAHSLHADIQPLSETLVAAERIQAIHPSLREFLTDSKRCEDRTYQIRLDTYHGRLADRCLSILGELFRNPTILSRVLGNVVQTEGTLQTRLRNSLPLEIQYACRYWSTHLRFAAHEEKLRLALAFMVSKIQDWIKVVDGLGILPEATRILHEAIAWCGNHPQMQETRVLLGACLRDLASRSEPTPAMPVPQVSKPISHGINTQQASSTVPRTNYIRVTAMPHPNVMPAYHPASVVKPENLVVLPEVLVGEFYD